MGGWGSTRGRGTGQGGSWTLDCPGSTKGNSPGRDGGGGCPTGRTLVERGRGHRSQHPHPLVLSRGGQTLLWLASGSLCP